MTGRTHDLAAFTALNVVFVVHHPPMSIATLGVAVAANMIGGLLPDIDNATSDIWDKVRGGSFIGKIVKHFVGEHRLISHSLLGMAIIGYLLKWVLTVASTVFLVDMDIVWWATMIGYFSHLVTDSMTTQGVPWLFPIQGYIGIPPFRWMRMKTGGIIEKAIVFPGLLIINGYIIYLNYPTYVTFMTSYLQ